MRKLLILLSGLFFVSAVSAATPYACSKDKSYSFANNLLNLTSPSGKTSQRYYLLNNTSSQSMMLDIAVHKGMSAGWASTLDAKHYSILAIDQANFSLRCSALNQQSAGKTINCAKVLSVCQLNTPLNKKLPNNGPGSYWLKEDF